MENEGITQRVFRTVIDGHISATGAPYDFPSLCVLGRIKIYMDSIKDFIRKKPTFFLIVSCLYLLGVGLFKWHLHPTVAAVWFLVGGGVGIYFLDGAELFFQLNPSPFRSVLFSALFAGVAFFIVTSSGSTLASGLVLSLYLQMLLWQIGEWRITGSLNSWYRMMVAPASLSVQRTVFGIFCVLFLFESYFFIL